MTNEAKSRLTKAIARTEAGMEKMDCVGR
jgi:hypothetical protein